MSTSSARKHRLPAGERKAAIVKAAVRLFSEKGFRGATTRELAAAVGVSEPVLYQHFATKNDLYSAIIEEICCDRDQHHDELLRLAEESRDDHAFFCRLGELILEWHDQETEALRLLLHSAMEGHELKERFFESQVAFLYELLTGYIHRRIEEGAFRTMDPYLAARAFTGMIAHQGMARNIFGVDDLEGSTEEIARRLVGIFLDGVRSPDNETNQGARK